MPIFAVELTVIFLVVTYRVLVGIGQLMSSKEVERSPLFPIIVFCSICLIFTYGAFISGKSIRISGFRPIVEKGESLIAAIDLYQEKYGSPPNNLEQLTPEFIEKIPRTGVAAYPQYQFIRNENVSRLGGNSWVLFVSVSMSPANQDALIFFPNKKYPSNGNGVYTKNVEGWVYIVSLEQSYIPVKSGEP